MEEVLLLMIRNYEIINDTYNASPASMKFGIERFSKMKTQKIVKYL